MIFVVLDYAGELFPDDGVVTVAKYEASGRKPSGQEVSVDSILFSPVGRHRSLYYSMSASK